MDQTVILVDKEGKHTGEYVEKDLAHTGRGKRHLAISVLLYNRRGQVLLQHRKHKIHNDIWDFTGSTHHLHRDNGTDETSEEATYRCLKREYGINEKIDLRVIGAVNYYAPYGEYCENEHDIILVGEYNGELKPNKEVAYDYKWVEENIFLKDIEKNPKKYAPWAVLGAKEIEKYQSNLFRQELGQFLRVFEPYAKRYFEKKIGETAKYPVLISQLYRDLYDFGAGGKKMRAFLVYLGYRIAGRTDLRPILPISLSVEVIHNFLLIHDDIIDKSQTRRGKPTVHKRYEEDYGEHYGISQAILVGDIACFEALGLINSSVFGDKKKLQLVSEIINILKETVYGEVLDVIYSYRKAKIADIWQVVDLKTARYSFVGPLKIGAMLGNVRKSQLEALFDFGIAAGKAFQLQDDILGVFGDEKVMGKSVITDLQEGKNTILIYKARELAKGKNKSDLERIWGKSNAKMADLRRARAIIKDAGALDWCSREALRLVNQAKQHIAGVTSNLDLRQVLNEIAEFVVTRKS